MNTLKVTYFCNGLTVNKNIDPTTTIQKRQAKHMKTTPRTRRPSPKAQRGDRIQFGRGHEGGFGDQGLETFSRGATDVHRSVGSVRPSHLVNVAVNGRA